MAVSPVIPDTLAKFVSLEQAAAAAPGWAQDNGTWIRTILDQHSAWLASENIAGYQAAYDGYLESIDTRDKSRGDDVNNKLQVNYAETVINTPVDYLTGKPIAWAVEDPEGKAPQELLDAYRKDLLQLVSSKQGQRIIAEQLRQGGIAGYSAVIAWVDEKGKIDYDEFPVQEVIPVYDVRGRLQLVLRAYEIETETIEGRSLSRTRVEVYDDRYVTYYISDETGATFELDEEETLTGNPIEHRAGRIPVSLFVNGTPARYEKRLKKNGVSDLANGVLTLLENYAAVMSDKANTVERLLDQYLTFIGCDVDEKEVLLMRKARAINLKAKDSDAKFIAQTQEDNSIENHLNRLRDTIHDMAQLPKLNDLSGATATEIKTKYANLDIKAGRKELYFSTALQQLVDVLTDMLNAKRLAEAGVAVDSVHDILSGAVKAKTQLYNPEWVTFTITHNMPQNFLEIAQIVKTLAGLAPDKDLLELLWFVDDPEAALEDLKKQKEEEAKRGLTALGLGGEFSQTGNNNPPAA